MKYLGDITKINGAEIEPVDVIVGGSPCQDLSVAGNRAGLDGKRSGLFMEQIRVIKEMRDATKRTNQLIRPRYMVWENVPGAFSSNKGEDFRAVLEETARIADGNTVIPRPPKNKWTTAGCVMGDGWSIAWRVQDAQFWGVPQRRRRIALVADFAGGCAGEILFESEGVSRDFTPSGSPWQRTAGNAEGSTGTSGGSITCLNDQGGSVISVTEDISATLKAEEHGHQPCIMQSSGFCTEPSAKSRSVGYEEERSPTLRAGVVPGTVLSFEPGAASRVGGHTDENISGAVRQERSVRRLTPLECERLQGYPDNWTNIPPQTEVTAEDLSFWRTVWDEWQAINGAKPKTDKQIIKWLKSEAADSARYKALGNSIALPPWRYVFGRIYQHGARTLGSLFDGIGGFPLIWSELSGTATLWASEIEPFCIAVTKLRLCGLRGGRQ